MNSPGVIAPVKSRNIEVLIDELTDGFAIEISMSDGQGTRVLVKRRVSSLVEAEDIASAYAAARNFDWHELTVICR
jgi:hypothetical protein